MRRAHCSASFSRPALALRMASLSPACGSWLATALAAALLLASLSAAPAQAQSAPPTAPAAPLPPAQVLNPAAATLPLTSPALPVSTAVAHEITDWRAANAAVGEFPRGHADVLKWEALQASKTSEPQQQHQSSISRPAPQPATQPAPAGHHHGAAQ